jgi:putative ABC transport system permease protein
MAATSTESPLPTRRALAPWVRTRLRAAPWAAAALAALVLVTAFLAAAMPRAVDAYEDRALRESLTHAGIRDRSVTVTADLAEMPPDSGAPLLSPNELAETETAFQQIVRPPLALDRDQTVYGVHNAEAVPASDPALPRPTPGIDPKATLVAQPGLATHTRLVSGRLPRAGSGAGTPGNTAEAVVTAKTARTLGLRAGSTIHLPSPIGTVLAVRVTGIVEPRDQAAAYWNAEPDLRAPTLVSVPPPPPEVDPDRYWHFTALLGDDAAAVALALNYSGEAYWYHPVDTAALTARSVPAIQAQLAGLVNGPAATRLDATGVQPGLTAAPDGLTGLLDSFARERAAASPLVLIAAVGVGTAAAAVLLMAGGLAAARRRAELELLRSRGGSLSGVGLRLLGESAASAVPAAAAGTLLALLLVPGGRYATALLLGALVAAAGSLALPVRAVAAHRRLRPAGREDLVAARPSRRRTVAELTVAVVVTGAVVALRRRGTAEGADPLTAAAPVLVAVIAALVLLRLYPLPLRLLARPAARLPGAVTHLGLARAGRAPATAALPLLAVLVALAVTSFGGSVLAGVTAGRDRAALTAVGADARVDSLTTLPDGLAARVRHVTGVRDVVSARIERGLATDAQGTAYDLVIVDPADYARLVAHTGLGGAFPAAALATGERKAVPPAVLPAVVSPGLAAQFGNGTVEVPAAAGPTTVRVAGVMDSTPADPDGQFVVVSAAAMARAHPDAAHTLLLAGTTLYVTGPAVSGKALRAVAKQASGELTVDVRTEVRATYGSTPLQSGARRVYLAAVAAGAGYSALALLLSLLQGAPQRGALLARLRTMGMSRRQCQALALLEMLPQALLAAIGGIAVGLATVALLRPGVDLTALAFTTRKPAGDLAGTVLRADPASLVLPSAGLLALACAVLAAQAWLTGRRGEGTDLRMGDRT